MFCTTVIPTIGRPTLSRAVESVLSQELPDRFEVIVVNDSGRPLPEAVNWRQEKVRVIATNRRERSVARNTGAAVAGGRYLHFLDDDDSMLPGAFLSFWELEKTTDAAWLCGGFRLTDNDGNVVTEIHPQLSGNSYIQLIGSEWLPLQASFIDSKAFFAVGGFASLHSLSGGFEDIDISRQIALSHDVAVTSSVVAGIRTGDQGSTTKYSNILDQDRRSREKALAGPGAFRRMAASATASAPDPDYWHGKIVYYYLASAVWNLRHKRPLTAASRGVHSVAGFARAGRRILATGFWQGATSPHFNQVRRSVEHAGVNPYANTIWE